MATWPLMIDAHVHWEVGADEVPRVVAVQVAREPWECTRQEHEEHVAMDHVDDRLGADGPVAVWRCPVCGSEMRTTNKQGRM